MFSGLLGVAYAYNNEKFHIRTYLDNVVATVQGKINHNNTVDITNESSKLMWVIKIIGGE